MSHEIKALDVLVAYINDHNGNIPHNPNKLVGYSCENLNLPTLDYFQAKTIMNTYQKNVDKLRYEQRQSSRHHSKSPQPKSKHQSSHYNSTSTEQESNSDHYIHQKTHAQKHHKRYYNPHGHQQSNHSTDSEQTHESTIYSSTNSHHNNPQPKYKHKYTSPKQQKYHSNYFKTKHKSNRRQQSQRSFYSSTSTESDSDSESDSDTDSNTDSDIKPSNIHSNPSKQTFNRTQPKQKHIKTKSANPFANDNYKSQSHYRANTNQNNRNVHRQNVNVDNRTKHKRKYKPQNQKRSQRSHQRVATESYNRNVNDKMRRPKQSNYKYERPAQQMRVIKKTREDFPQHSGYTKRVRTEDKYRRGNVGQTIELQTPKYEHDTSESTGSSVSNESSLHSSELSSSTLSSETDKEVRIVRKHAVNMGNDVDRKQRNVRKRYAYRGGMNNQEVELEIIPTSKRKNVRRHVSDRNDNGERVMKNRKTKMKHGHGEHERKIKTLKSTKTVDNGIGVTDSKLKRSEGSVDNDNIDDDDLNGCKKICYIIVGAILGIGLILCAILIPLSLKRVEFNESAIRYNGLTKEVDDEAYSEGRYVMTPQTKMIVFDTIVQKLHLKLNCLTSDGVIMNIEVVIQYNIPHNNIYKIWNDYGKEGRLDTYLKLIASDSIRDSIGSVTAGIFYTNRYDIQNKIEIDLNDAIEKSYTYVNMITAIMTGYGFPEDLKETIRMKRNAENDFELAKNERDGNITTAETNLLVAEINATRLMMQARAEKESILAEAYAKGEVITNQFEYRKQLMLNMIERYNMTTNQFIEGWLTAFVLLHANDPYTTTLLKNDNYSGLLVGMRF